MFIDFYFPFTAGRHTRTAFLSLPGGVTFPPGTVTFAALVTVLSVDALLCAEPEDVVGAICGEPCPGVGVVGLELRPDGVCWLPVLVGA